MKILCSKSLLTATILFIFGRIPLAQTLSPLLDAGHEADVQCLDFSPDGKLLATGGSDSTLKVWHVASGKVVHTFKAGSKINSVGFEPGGRLVASGSVTGAIVLWDISTGKRVRALGVKEVDYAGLSFHPQGKMLATSFATASFLGAKGGITLLDTESGAILFSEEKITGCRIEAIRFDRQGKWVACGDKCGNIVIMDVRTKTKTNLWVTTITGAASTVRSLSFSSDGKILSSSHADGSVNLWDVQGRKWIRTLSDPDLREPVTSVDFNPKGDELAAASAAGVVIWHKDGWIIHRFEGYSTEYKKCFNDLAYSPDGKLLAACSGCPDKIFDFSGKRLGDNTITLWHSKSYLPLRQFREAAAVSRITSALLSPDGRFLAWRTPRLLQVFDTQWGHIDKNLSTASDPSFSADGQWMAHVAPDDQLKLYRTVSWQEAATSSIKCKSAFFTADTSHVFTVAPWSGLSKWSLPDLKAVFQIDGKNFRLDSLKVSTARNAAVCPDTSGRFYVWDLAGARIEGTFEHKHVEQADISADGAFVLSYSFNYEVQSAYRKARTSRTTIKLWDVKRDTLLVSWDNLEGRARFSSDGRLVIWWDRTVLQSYDLVSRSLKTITPGGMISQAAASPDGQGIAIAIGQEAIQLWDARQATLLRTIPTGFTAAQLYYDDSGGVLTAKTFGGYYHWNPMTGKKSGPPKSGETAVKHFSYQIEEGDLVLKNRNTGEKIRVIHLGKSDFMLLAGDNYFLAPKGSLDDVYFRFGGEVYSFDQFDLVYNRPDMILKKLGFPAERAIAAYERAYKKRVEKMGASGLNAANAINPPVVELKEDDLEPLTFKSKVVLPITVSDPVCDLDHVEIYLNGVPVRSAGANLREEKTRKVSRNFEVELSAGENVIEVLALNTCGLSSLKRTTTITYERAANLYVVTLGVSQYEDQRYNLVFAAKDARDVVSFYTSFGSYKFNNVYKYSLTDQQVRRDSLAAIRAFLSGSTVDDQIILFVSGHGLLDEAQDWFLATYDTDFSQPSGRGISFSDIEELLSEAPARKRLLLIDACNSGEIDKAGLQQFRERRVSTGTVRFRGNPGALPSGQPKPGGGDYFELMNNLFMDIRRGSGATVIASSKGIEFSYEDERLQNGIFTFALLEGLKTGKADYNRDGSIVASEIKYYLEQQVSQLSEGQQRPTARGQNLVFDFRVW